MTKTRFSFPGRKRFIVIFVLLLVKSFIVTDFGMACLPGSGHEDLPETIIIEGKTLTLNGIAKRKVLWYTVFTGSLYLEQPTSNPHAIIESNQIKYIREHFLLPKISHTWVQRVVRKLFYRTNPEELCDKHKDKIERFASWFDEDVDKGDCVVTTYVPGQGLTLEYNGVIKGTINNKEFVRMYFSCGFGDKANEEMKQGLCGA